MAEILSVSRDEALSLDSVSLDSVLLDGSSNRMRLLPAAEYSKYPHVFIRGWASLRARYTLPTIELVQWLNERIGTATALEVGAGMGDLGYYLGIPQSDSAMQSSDQMRAFYKLIMQATTDPPSTVMREDAVESVKKHRPDVVIASWLTQKQLEGESTGNPFGPDEEEILHHCKTYIHIGNDDTHGEKRILKHPHHVIRADWIVSRAARPANNNITVWKGWG
jgi:hypothetical protein